MKVDVVNQNHSCQGSECIGLLDGASFVVDISYLEMYPLRELFILSLRIVESIFEHKCCLLLGCITKYCINISYN